MRGGGKRWIFMCRPNVERRESRATVVAEIGERPCRDSHHGEADPFGHLQGATDPQRRGAGGRGDSSWRGGGSFSLKEDKHKTPPARPVTDTLSDVANGQIGVEHVLEHDQPPRAVVVDLEHEPEASPISTR